MQAYDYDDMGYSIAVRRALCRGMFMNVACLVEYEYVQPIDGHRFQLHPSSCLKRMPGQGSNRLYTHKSHEAPSRQGGVLWDQMHPHPSYKWLVMDMFQGEKTGEQDHKCSSMGLEGLLETRPLFGLWSKSSTDGNIEAAPRLNMQGMF